MDSGMNIIAYRMFMLESYYANKFSADIYSFDLQLNAEQIYNILLNDSQLLPQQIVDDMCPSIDDPDYNQEEVQQILSDILKIINTNTNTIINIM